MPNNIVKSFAKKSGKSVKEVEKLWKKAEAIAKEEGISKKSFYSYITGTLKNMLNLKEENMSFKDFYNTKYITEASSFLVNVSGTEDGVTKDFSFTVSADDHDDAMEMAREKLEDLKRDGKLPSNAKIETVEDDK